MGVLTVDQCFHAYHYIPYIVYFNRCLTAQPITTIPLVVFLNLITTPQVRGYKLCLHLWVETYSKYPRKFLHIYLC